LIAGLGGGQDDHVLFAIIFLGTLAAIKAVLRRRRLTP
jgi:hypothetical protein